MTTADERNERIGQGEIEIERRGVGEQVSGGQVKGREKGCGGEGVKGCSESRAGRFVGLLQELWMRPWRCR
jgi:hypothetical protein